MLLIHVFLKNWIKYSYFYVSLFPSLSPASLCLVSYNCHPPVSPQGYLPNILICH